MKELITEQQADQIILLLSILVTLGGLGFGFYQAPRVAKNQKQSVWINGILSALVGPVIWGFWQLYNSIENYYGLDSLKALKINFFIALGLGALFFALFTYAPRLIQPSPAPRRRK